MAAALSFTASILYSILDWPEQIQTSPTSRFFSVSCRLPLVALKVTGPFSEAFMAGRFTDHPPVASEVVLARSPVLICTCTGEFGDDCPQIFSGWSRCNTMLSLNTFASRSWPMTGIISVCVSVLPRPSDTLKTNSFSPASANAGVPASVPSAATVNQAGPLILVKVNASPSLSSAYRVKESLTETLSGIAARVIGYGEPVKDTGKFFVPGWPCTEALSKKVGTHILPEPLLFTFSSTRP